jgi:hypothetical protein
MKTDSLRNFHNTPPGCVSVWQKLPCFNDTPDACMMKGGGQLASGNNLKRERSETGYDYHWKYPALAT